MQRCSKDLYIITSQHVVVRVIRNREDVRGHLCLPSSLEFHSQSTSINRDSLVWIDRHTKETGISLEILEPV